MAAGLKTQLPGLGASRVGVVEQHVPTILAAQ